MKYGDKAKCPLIATPGSAGSDLFSTKNYKVPQMATFLVEADLCFSLPKNTFGLLSGRSGLALLGVHTHVGITDSDYRGPVGIIMTSLTGSEFQIKEGERVGQITICPYQKPK